MRFKYDKRLKTILLKNFLLFFVGFFLFIIILMLPLWWYMTDMNKEKINDINKNFCARSQDMCETIMKEAEMYAVSLSIDTDVEAFVSAQEYNRALTKRIQSNLRFYKNINDYIDAVGIVSAKSGYTLSETDIVQSNGEELTLCTAAPGKTDITGFAKSGKYPFVIRFLRGIDISGNRGAVFVDIDIDRFNNLFKSIDTKETDSFFIVGSDGKIIYGADLNNEFGKPYSDIVTETAKDRVRFGGETYVQTKAESTEYDFTYFSLMPVESYSVFSTSIWKLILLVAVMSIVLAVVFAFMLSRRSVNPVGMILSSIEQPGGNKKNIPEDIRSIVDEIVGAVGRSYENENERNMRMLLLRFTQVQVMESQMNPHFLYNSLDSINWIAFRELGRFNRISECIDDLSEVFRLGLSNDGYVVPFEEELRHAAAFSRLLKTRYPEIVDIDFDIQERTKELTSIRFMLQPMIENAMYHGIKPTGRHGRVLVSAGVGADGFVIEVTDNGAGMTEEKLAKVNEALRTGMGEAEEEVKKVLISWQEAGNADSRHSQWLERKQSDVGIGLKNVNNRIKLIFGEDYGISVRNNNEGGVTVRIVMPEIKWI